MHFDRDKVASLIRDEPDKVSYARLSALPKFDCYSRVVFENQDTDFVVCNTCNDNKLHKYDTEKGTGAINLHVESHSSSTNSTGVIQAKIDCYTKRKVKDADKSKMSGAAAVCCAIDFRPFTMIEGIGMINLIQTAINIGSKRGQINAADVLSKGDAVRKHLDEIYDDLKLKLKAHIEKIASTNLTTDHWTDKYSGISYMTMTRDRQIGRYLY